MKKFLLVLALGLIAFTATACGDDEDVDPDPDPDPDNGDVDPDPDPDPDPVTTFDGVGDITVDPLGPDVEAFDPLAGVTAEDEDEGDLTDNILFVGTVDQMSIGEYVLVYYVTNARGETVFAKRTVTVEGILYPSGWFSYQFADADTRHELFGAMERYLLETMYGGIPVFANAGFVMYSSRVELPVEEFIPVMGFSALRGSMSEDDANISFAGSTFGNADEYTYRTALGQNPATLHQWIYQDATSSDVLSLILDSLYFFDFNEERDGFEVKPSMATHMPQPQDTEVLPTGSEIATTWQVPIREDLVWTYHPDTDTSGFADGHETINAHDFLATFQLALDEGWFRAIAGGGDFTSPPQEIKNAQAYIDGDVDFDEVGLRALDDYTLEFEFASQIDEWGVIYWLSSFVMTPINMELYNEIEGLYGTTAETTAYTGPFMLAYYEADQVLDLVENENFHSPDRYFFTGVQFQIIADATVRFQAFLSDDLDAVGVPGAEFEEVAGDPRLRQVPGPTTFRIMINMLGTPEAQEDMFGNSDLHTPEPILANQHFRTAMYFAIDRAELAFNVLRTSAPQQFLYTEAYLVEPLSGIAFRNTDAGLAVGEGLSASTYGFNPDVAQAFWVAALDELVAEGIYENDEVIELELLIFSGSEAQVSFGNFIKSSFEELFDADSNEYGISVELTVEPKDFPGIYFDWMMVGRFDLSIGGISGSTLNASGFMDVFADDNRGGFTLNWGIDTSTANIQVEILNFDTGEMEQQMWSFNALQRALVGRVYVEFGEEATPDED